jgi:hypothetical protein
MSKIRTRHLGAAAVAVGAGVTLFATAAGAASVPSFQQIQSSAKDNVITSNCYFQVTYVSLVTGTLTGKMNGQAQSTNFLNALNVKSTSINCTLSNSAGDQVSVANLHSGYSAQTGVHFVTLPLSDHYTLCTAAQQTMNNNSTHSVGNCETTP